MPVVEVPRIPDYGLTRLANRRRVVQTDILLVQNFCNHTLDKQTFTELVTACRRGLKLKKAHEFALRETLMPFADQEVTECVAETIALKLAGGFHLLRQGKAVMPYSGVAEPTWMPVEIISVRFGRVSKRGSMLANIVFMIMAGAGASYTIKQLMPMKFITTLFAGQIGWPKFERRPHHTELVKMWFMALVAPGKKGDEVTQYECASHQLKYNKKLRKARLSPCIRGFRIRCHVCPLGYALCERGTHRCSWIKKPCPGCEQEALFDPEEANQRVCLACRTKQSRRNWARERRGG